MVRGSRGGGGVGGSRGWLEGVGGGGVGGSRGWLEGWRE